MRKVLFHNGADRSHRLVLSELVLRDHVHYPDYGSGKEDPMESVNALYSYLSRFLTQRLGFDRDGSQDWVNLFWASMGFRPLKIAAKYIIEGDDFHRNNGKIQGFLREEQKKVRIIAISQHTCAKEDMKIISISLI